MGTEQRKVAFVTGASSGIGRATSLIFAANGYATAMADLNEAGGKETEAMGRDAGGECMFVSCNVADEASVKSAIEQTVEAYGRLDAAFNAAGIDGEPGKTTAECSTDNWDKIMAVNLKGLWYCMRNQIPAMLKSGGGAIVNCSSAAGITGAPFCAAYSASKHGVVGLTRSAALEYASQGIRVNAVCPGMIRTPMTQSEGMKAVVETLAADSPIQRMGEPEEIGEAVLWLCSDGASYVHGQALPVDGAWTSR